MKAYQELEQRFRRLSALGGALAVLGWDQSTMMPPGGSAARTEQVATLSVLRHELLSDPRLADLLAEAEQGKAALTPWHAANLREMRRVWRHANALDSRLVDARSRATSACEMVWRTARANDDFRSFAPSFAEVIAITREVAAAKGAAFGTSPYDALIDEYEPGAKAAQINALFADLAEFLPGFLDTVMAHQALQPAVIDPEGPFSTEAQRTLGLHFMRTLGFDFDHGRLDISLHPFTGGVPDDVRITTRYSEDDFTHALMGVLHETGHALYELGLPRNWLHQPVGEARGMALHESQSLLIEMQVCRGAEFLGWAIPQLRQAFNGKGDAWGADNIHRLYTRVEPDLIRVEADEVTYPAHVILRYRLEQALLNDDLPLDDLPAAWADGMQTLLGVEVPTDSEGCLQDIHWPTGSFGYFPTYTMGALAAAQLFAAAKQQQPAILPGIAKGDFQPLLAWLRQNVHSLGSLHTTDELLVKATGAPLGTAAFKAHLASRYLG